MTRLERRAGGEAVHAWHPGIEEDQIRRVHRRLLQCLGAGQGETQIAQVAQGREQDLDGLGLIVDDQDPGGGSQEEGSAAEEDGPVAEE